MTIQWQHSIKCLQVQIGVCETEYMNLPLRWGMMAVVVRVGYVILWSYTAPMDTPASEPKAHMHTQSLFNKFLFKQK